MNTRYTCCKVVPAGAGQVPARQLGLIGTLATLVRPLGVRATGRDHDRYSRRLRHSNTDGARTTTTHRPAVTAVAATDGNG
jgi:hypothetical protein